MLLVTWAKNHRVRYHRALSGLSGRVLTSILFLLALCFWRSFESSIILASDRYQKIHSSLVSARIMVFSFWFSFRDEIQIVFVSWVSSSALATVYGLFKSRTPAGSVPASSSSDQFRVPSSYRTKNLLCHLRDPIADPAIGVHPGGAIKSHP